MRLYHGSNQAIDNIDLSKSNKYKDFGKGFYLTSILDQAIERAIGVANRSGGVPTVNIYEFDDSNLSIKMKKFDKSDIKWAKFIVNNRNKNFEDFDSELSNQDNKYDIVYGPIADDNVLNFIGLFLNDYIDEKTLVKKLKYRKLNNQYSFHTNKAISLLKKIDDEIYYKTTLQDTIIMFLTENIVNLLSTTYNVNIEEAMRLFYETEISKKIEDVSTLYYKESISYLFELVKEEIEKNKVSS